MSRISEIFRVQRDMSVAAKEEQARLGHPQIDVEHLLLGLTVIGGQATTVLEQHGVTLERAREAVAGVHRRRTAELGISVPPEPDRTMDVDRMDAEFTERALVVMRRDDPEVYDLEILRALLHDPSGLVPEVLDELGVDRAHLLDALSPRTTARTAPVSASRWPEVSTTGYVPRSAEVVFDLLADPGRWSAWHGWVHRAEVDARGVVVATHLPEHCPGPAAWVTRRLSWLRSEHVVVAADPQRSVTWSGTLIDAWGRSASSRLTIQLAPEGRGTRLTWTVRPPRPTRFGPARPLQRWWLRQVLAHDNVAVSRALR